MDVGPFAASGSTTLAFFAKHQVASLRGDVEVRYLAQGSKSTGAPG
jgi:hypothetical protein